MTTATDQQPQPSLFAAPPSIENEPEDTRPVTTDPEPETNQQLVEPPATITTEELIDHIFQSMCKGRRWERELLLGADQSELGRTFGNCWCSGREIELQFRAEGEPALQALDAVFKTEVFTLSASEIATYVRRIVGIPKKKSDEERKAALDNLFNQLRLGLRRETLSYIRSLLGEKMPRKTKKTTTEPPPTLSNQVADLLFTTDCLTEQGERRLLLRIILLLIKKGNHNALAATKHAVSIIEAARSRWQSAIAYWQDTQQPSSYQPAKQNSQDQSSPP